MSQISLPNTCYFIRVPAIPMFQSSLLRTGICLISHEAVPTIAVFINTQSPASGNSSDPSHDLDGDQQLKVGTGKSNRRNLPDQA